MNQTKPEKQKCIIEKPKADSLRRLIELNKLPARLIRKLGQEERKYKLQL